LAPLLAASQFWRPLRSDTDFTEIVEALRAIYTGSQVNSQKPRHGPHQKFRDLEERWQAHSIEMDRLLGNGTTAERPVLHAFQQTLFLQCPRAGKTAGRFRCINQT